MQRKVNGITVNFDRTQHGICYISYSYTMKYKIYTIYIKCNEKVLYLNLLKHIELKNLHCIIQNAIPQLTSNLSIKILQ